MKTEDSRDLSESLKPVSDHLLNRIINIVESEVSSPLVSLGVGELTNLVSTNIQNNLIRSDLTKEA